MLRAPADAKRGPGLRERPGGPRVLKRGAVQVVAERARQAPGRQRKPGLGKQPGARSSENRTLCGQEPQQRANRRSPRAKPAQSLRSGVVVNAKVLGDGADANATVVHHGNRRRDRLVDGQRNGLEELSLNQDLGDGAKPFRTRPPFSPK